jgi:hypothetical protein
MTMLQLRATDLDWREIDEDIVILDGRDASYLTLNGSGALLWRTLADGATRDELIGVLLAAYEVDATTAGSDADAFLDNLHERGFLAA